MYATAMCPNPYHPNEFGTSSSEANNSASRRRIRSSRLGEAGENSREVVGDSTACDMASSHSLEVLTTGGLQVNSD